MFKKVTLQEWEDVVKKQLKTEDLYQILHKDNLEGLSVKPYYNSVAKPLHILPKVEESTHLVAPYHASLEGDVYAFFLNENVEGLKDKTVFINDVELVKQSQLSEVNRYFSLVDVFDEKSANLDENLASELLAKNFKRAIIIDISLYQNAGASIVQQVGIALAKAKELAEHFGESVLNKLVFRLSVGSNYFFEIAKIRALKLAFNQLSKEYNLDEIPYIFAETSLRNKAIQDEENNLIRSTLELAAGMIGGADAVFANDYKINHGTELSKEISFKQQIVLAYESIINVFGDAANGSYYVEDLTQQIAEQSWQYFLEIENNGGFLSNLKSGKIQKDIYNQAVKEQNWVKEGKIKLIGVNLYPSLEVKKSTEDLYSENEIRKVRWAEMYE